MDEVVVRRGISVMPDKIQTKMLNPPELHVSSSTRQFPCDCLG